MMTDHAPKTAAAVADDGPRPDRLTVPLTAAQSALITATARRLGWTKATLAREGVFRFLAAIEASAALDREESPLISFIPLDQQARQ